MNLIFFRPDTHISNFGDELNYLLFNKLFGEVFNNPKYNDVNFYGIGSIIDHRIDYSKKNVLFGTGIRDLTLPYNTSNLDIRFIRGSVTSNILGLKGQKIIADGAYALLNCPDILPSTESKIYDYSLMPHYKQMDSVNWKKLEKITNIHIIDPRLPVKNVLDEIAKSKKLLTIAMHGAIAADILRVPWLRIKMEAIGSEAPYFTEIKWLDFQSAINVKTQHIKINKFERFKGSRSFKRLLFLFELTQKIKEGKKSDLYQLSSSNTLSGIKQNMQNAINLFIKDYQ